MRILLAANASYDPPKGGATRSNLAWIGRLRAKGHSCRIVAGFKDPPHRGAVLEGEIRSFQPDWVLVSSEDIGQVLLRAAHAAASGRVIYLAHTPQFFPFGPASWNPDAQGTELVARCVAAVAISRYVAEYIEHHAGCRATVIHPPVYGRPPFQKLGDGDLIVMINPCAVKGISIFLALARRFPGRRFGALPGWGTTSADREGLATAGNITLLEPCEKIEAVLSRARVLLVPSLWHEGFGLVVTEAMLRGIPVLASNLGGLVEAKLGTRFVLPVHPIERYEAAADETGMPRAVLAEQDIEPWAEALDLLNDPMLYEHESEASRAAALDFVESIREDALEEFLKVGQAFGLPTILMAQNSHYYPAHGGGDKSNRILLEALAAKGYKCRAVARISNFGPQGHEQFLSDLRTRGVAPKDAEPGEVLFDRNGVEVHTATTTPNFRAYFAGQIAAFQPSLILISTDDPVQLLLPAALAAQARVVFLARTTLALPFGPDSAFPSPEKTDLLRNADAVIGVSRYVSDYIRRWSGIESIALPISLPEPGPYPDLAGFENEFVTMVNPCAVKGISIFLALAERMPDVQFAAVPTWGTTSEDRAALARHANVRILDPVDDIDRLLVRTRVLLVPSLWAEARSRIVLEAMLRGIPVLASNVGGIPEAKLGVPYLLPVRPVERYRPNLDEKMVPVAEVPEQNIGPWLEALETLLSSRLRCEELSKASREAALAWVSTIGIAPFEKLIEQVMRSPKRGPATPVKPRTLVQSLSPEKRALVARRLRERQYFGAEETSGRLRLFCFPFAGGGAAAFRGWTTALPHLFVCPARLPGREGRVAEPPFTRMSALVAALTTAIEPWLAQPFAFFGHSMGAVVAFELARSLRRHQRPLPACLLVSGARAPQFRRGHEPPPEPSEQELLRELRHLEGLPDELLRWILPALRADATLYRNYVYAEEPPLACPIRAYGGSEDPNVLAEHLDAWREQTASNFAMRLFPGNHFFIDTAQAALLQEIGRFTESELAPLYSQPRSR